MVELPEDIVGCVLRCLDLPSLQTFMCAAASSQHRHGGDDGQATTLCTSRRSILSWIARRRIPWAVAILEKGCEFSTGTCVVHDCDRQRLSLLDLTGPANYAFVLTPYCGACAAKHRGPYSVLRRLMRARQRTATPFAL